MINKEQDIKLSLEENEISFSDDELPRSTYKVPSNSTTDVSLSHLPGRHVSSESLVQSRQENGVTRSLFIRCKTSEITLIDIDQTSRLYEALIQLPERLCKAKTYGISMTSRFYNGQLRNPNYVENRMNAHFRALELNRFKGKKIRNEWSDLTCEILRIVAHNRGFLSYDKLNEILALKGHSWRVLTSMKGKEKEDLTNYPTYTEKQDREIKMAQSEEENEEAAVKTHEESLKRRRLIKDLEEVIPRQESDLHDWEELALSGDADAMIQAKETRQLVQNQKLRLQKLRLEESLGGI